MCEWSLKRYEAAAEAIAELTAIGTENGLKTQVFAHLIDYPSQDESIVAMPGGGYGLLVPSGETSEFVLNLFARVFVASTRVGEILSSTCRDTQCRQWPRISSHFSPVVAHPAAAVPRRRD